MAYNPYIVVPLATWAVAQITKFAISAFKGKVDFRYLYASGGMPSVHSAVVCSLAMTALLVDGLSSHLFGFTAIFAVIVMYDSVGVRRTAGETAVAMNMLMESLEHNKVKLERPGLRLREMLGHQPREVMAGAILGIGLGLLFNYDKLGKFGSFLQSVPKRPEVIVYAAVFLAVLVAGVVARLVLRAKYPKSKIIKTVAARIIVATQTVGWLGLISAAFIYENASYLAWRLWPLLIMVAGLLWAAALVSSYWKVLPETLASEANEARKLRWLNWGRDKKRKSSKRA